MPTFPESDPSAVKPTPHRHFLPAMKTPESLTRRDFVIKTATAATALVAASPGLFAQGTTEKHFKLIGFTKPFQNLNFEETADTVAEIGWDGVECPVRPKGQGQIEPERAPDELPRLVQALKSRGKELTLLTTAITDVSQPHTERLLRTAAALGIRRYRLGFWKYDLAKPIPDQTAETSAQLRDLAALNAELGLQAGFQNHSGRDYVGSVGRGHGGPGVFPVAQDHELQRPHFTASRVRSRRGTTEDRQDAERPPCVAGMAGNLVDHRAQIHGVMR
jgi:hypothetical protein